MNTVYCPNCRVAVSPSDILCPACGAHQHLHKATATTPRNPFCCASCGNEAVQKVSALVQGGTWSAQATGTFGGASYVADSNGGHVVPFAGATQTSTAGASHLARILAAPRQPVLANNHWATAVGFFWAITSFACLFNLFTMSDTSAYTLDFRHKLVVVAVVCGVIGLAFLFPALQAKANSHERLEEETAEWNRHMQKWNELFYCGRCDSVYNGQTGHFAASQQMHRLF